MFACFECRDMGGNYILSVDGGLFSGLSKLQDLMLPHNLISRIPKDTFQGLTMLQVL